MKLIAAQESHFEKVLASYLSDDIKLSPFEEEMKKRIKTAFSLLLNFRGREQAVKALVEQFDISQATAYRDVSNALKIYGDVTKASKEGMRYIIFEYNQTILQLALKEKNLTEAGKAMDRMIKLADLDKEENLVNLEKLDAMDITITIGKKAEKAIIEQNNRGVVDLNDFSAEDVDFIEINEGEDED